MSSALITEVDTPQAELLQICRRVVRSEMSPDAAFALIKNMKKTNPSTSSLLEDVLWLIDMEMAIEKKNDDSTKKFNELLSLISNEIVPEDVLKFELDALGANDTTFNLLREESEGYAKLITELLDSNNECVPSTLIRLHRLIGQFNLDPNRVLDIILECFESSTNRRQFFISLLNDFKTNTDDLCSILGFKFTFYQQNGDTPPSLYELAAILCSERVIDLISLCSFVRIKQFCCARLYCGGVLVATFRISAAA
ncbi:unnamed protein product [Anisakis simplex]|uniref:THO complex subunit 2 (inferred by orthology to a human protein) n=1 Tax=Anisakis simplex TaxID=6269 RepID=A0A0M3KD41_ANISI|nr:unnamed protein product [Anisakis simplex]